MLPHYLLPDRSIEGLPLQLLLCLHSRQRRMLPRLTCLVLSQVDKAAMARELALKEHNEPSKFLLLSKQQLLLTTLARGGRAEQHLVHDAIALRANCVDGGASLLSIPMCRAAILGRKTKYQRSSQVKLHLLVYY